MAALYTGRVSVISCVPQDSQINAASSKETAARLINTWESPTKHLLVTFYPIF